MNIIPRLSLLLVCLISLPGTVHAGGANAPFEGWGLPILKQSPSTAEFLLSNFNVQEMGIIQTATEDKARIAKHGKAHFRVKYLVSSKANPDHRFVLYMYTKGLDAENIPIFKSIEFVPCEESR